MLEWTHQPIFRSDMTDEAFFKAQYPKLISKRDVPGVSAHALAARNMRIMLKQHFPGRKFSVKTSVYAGGTSLNIRWSDLDLDDDEARVLGRQVQALADRFSLGEYNGMDDSYTYATGEHRAFTDLFGAAKYVLAQAEHRSDLKVAQHRKEMLEKALPTQKTKKPSIRI